MNTWDDRFRAGEYPRDPDPSPVLRRYLDSVPAGRALDVATGTGRNAVFLAAAGYEVDAVDKSQVGLEQARENAREQGAEEPVNWIQGDVATFTFPTDRYQLVTVSYYRAIDRFPDLKEALADGGYLFVEHHLRSTDGPASGPQSDRYRFGANELLNSCLDLTVLYYDETTEERSEGRLRANARLLARKSSGVRQSYPRRNAGAEES